MRANSALVMWEFTELDDEDARMVFAWAEMCAICPEYAEARARLGYFPPAAIRIYSAIYRDGRLSPRERLVAYPRRGFRTLRGVVNVPLPD